MYLNSIQIQFIFELKTNYFCLNINLKINNYQCYYNKLEVPKTHKRFTFVGNNLCLALMM